MKTGLSRQVLPSLGAAQTLQALTGQNFPADQPGQWDQWWTNHQPSTNTPAP